MSARALLRTTRVHAKLFASAQALRDDERFCRLCHGDENFSDMLAPCDCTGSMKWAHSSCLDELVKNDGGTDGSCSICGRTFNYIPKSPTASLVKTYLEWLMVYAVLLGFPMAWWVQDWPLMILWAGVPGLWVLFAGLLVFYPGQLRIGPKAPFSEEVFSVFIQIMAAFNVCMLFVMYCTLLRWSVDFQRLWPSTVSFIVCQAVSFSLGSAFYVLVGFPEDADEDEIYGYLFFFGLGLWSVIRAEVVPGALPGDLAPHELLTPTGQCPVRPLGGLLS